MTDARAKLPSTSAAATVSKATVRAARALGLTNAAIAVILGLSEATISRLSAGTFILDRESKPYELALLLVRLFRSLDAMVNGEEAPMRGWMQSPNSAVGGVPAERIKTVTGLVETLSYVDGARARI
jgi:hypothetical protein